MIGRRVFVQALAFAVVGVPLRAEGQTTKVARVGFLSTASPRSASWFQAFDQRLSELGYVEGRNLNVDFQNADGRVERLPELAVHLVRLGADVIVASGPEATLRAARGATQTIPIIVVAVDYDPVALRYVAGLARPGGSITGLVARQPELTAKRLEFLRAAFPNVTRVAVLWDPLSADQLRSAKAAVSSLSVQLQPVELGNPAYDYASAFDRAVRSRARAILLLMSPIFARDRARILDLAAKRRLPVVAGSRSFVEVGAVMAYGVNLSDMFRRAAEYVDSILRGAKAADLPIEQPTKFELVINMKTAKALGLTIPQSLLVRADEIIQ